MSDKIRHTLSGLEVQPPAGSWAKIAETLGEQDAYRDLSGKLFNHSAFPDERNWELIREKLAEQYLAEKLLQHEVAVPRNAWENIISQLTRKSSVKQINWYRYAAAAAIVIAIGIGTFNYFQSAGNANNNVAAGHLPTAKPAGTNIEKTRETLNEIVHTGAAEITDTDKRNAAALEASKKSYAKLDLKPGKLTADISGFYFDNNTAVSARNIDSDNQQNIRQLNADRYITLMTPEGNIIRVSKKLGGMVCCISGDTEDAECNDQLKKWREKLISSPLGHSADSFLDLINLVNSSSGQDPI